MRIKSKKIIAALGGVALVMTMTTSAAGAATPKPKIKVVPGTFVAAPGECGAGDPGARSKDVKAKWVSAVGGYAIQLSKINQTCSAAYADVVGVNGALTNPAATLDTLSLEFRDDSVVGGNIRFNFTDDEGDLFFISFTNATQEPAPINGAGWTKYTVNLATDVFPANYNVDGATVDPSFAPGSNGIRELTLLLDTVSTATADNITLNGSTIFNKTPVLFTP